MATLSIIIPKHRKRRDDTYNVKIRVIHNRKTAQISTEHYVKRSQLTNDLNYIKDEFILDEVTLDVIKLRREISKLGVRINNYTASELAEILNNKRIGVVEGVNFIEFCETEVNRTKEEKGKNGTFYINNTVLKWLKEFVRSDFLEINDINKNLLNQFESFLQTENVGTAGISAYMRGLRSLFIKAMDLYNDEARDIIRVNHFPFRRYKIKEHRAEKRSLDIETINKIRNYIPVTKRSEFAKDMFFLILYLAGISPVDLYKLTGINKKGRIEYYRDKVKSRTNKIKLSILVQPEAKEIIDKYSMSGFLSEVKRYASEKELSKAIIKGLETICQIQDIEERITAYWARHTFATIATECLKIDTSKVDYALGHTTTNNKMAEVYIKRDSNTIDEIIRDVIDYINN